MTVIIPYKMIIKDIRFILLQIWVVITVEMNNALKTL